MARLIDHINLKIEMPTIMGGGEITVDVTIPAIADLDRFEHLLGIQRIKDRTRGVIADPEVVSAIREHGGTLPEALKSAEVQAAVAKVVKGMDTFDGPTTEEKIDAAELVAGWCADPRGFDETGVDWDDIFRANQEKYVEILLKIGGAVYEKTRGDTAKVEMGN